ncbi:MAG: serine/threonine-protein phosphatase [Chloroflexi bacterium]|nr:serine/threonine-protein phosphatase [Chloroflexota bacterium]
MIPSERAHIHIAAVSNAGLSGKNNEDRYAVSAFKLETTPSIPSVFAIVADGIGGHSAGEVASEMAVESICRYIAASNGSQPVSALNSAIVQAGQEINIAAESNREHHGMGSTCACAWIIGDRFYMATVGDSRVYLLRGSTIRQLSKDHTWVQEALDKGAISAHEAHNHPNAHVIRRYLGSRQAVVPDFRIRLSDEESDTQAIENQGMTLFPGDHILLCSDGLTDLVGDEEILSYVSNKKGKHALNDLVNLANQRGGHDNITIITLSIPQVTKQSTPQPSPIKKTRRSAPCLLAGILLFIALLIIGGYFWYFNSQTLKVNPTPSLSFDRLSTLPSVIIPQATQPLPAVLPVTPLPTSPASVDPDATLQQISPPLQFTLTPWPTNTQAP